MPVIPDDPNMAQAWISGEPPDQTIDFYIPRGNTGLTGAQGPIGPSLLVGSIETVSGPAAPGTVGATGLTGAQGNPGGIVLGTLIANSTDWNTLTADGVYRTVTAASMVNAPPNVLHGILYVNNVETAIGTRPLQTFYPAIGGEQGRVHYQRGLAGGTWQPWRSFNSTRVDQTAGRAIYQWDNVNNREQLIYGDTGVRDVVSLLSANWTIVSTPDGNVWLHRKGNTVTLTVQRLTRTSAGITVLTIPLGFRPDTDKRGTATTLSATPAVHSFLTRSTGAFEFEASVPAAPGVNLTHTYLTNDAWPATLPGTAVGSIPNL